MLNGKKVFVIIGAAGTGKRMGAPLPKQFLKIGGKTILEKTVSVFETSDVVDELIIVTHKDYIDLCEELFEGQDIQIIAGGIERQDSIYNALKAIVGASEDDIVLVHDAVRPHLTKELIDRVTFAALEHKAVVPSVPPKDTIRHDDEGTLDRSKLHCVQTPQGFKYDVLKSAYEKAFDEGFYGTDDAGLVEKTGQPVTIVDGEVSNFKITTPEDLKVENRIGTGFDVHKLVENRKLILGGVDIPYEKGLDGHSDADVLIHALMDAMLGACALGDIGKLFPDTDMSFKGISSMKLLAEVWKEVIRRGYGLVNADVTVICQKPKLAPYIDEMRNNICMALGCDFDRISIKATTTEKLGFTGRGEGIACEAVVLMQCSG